MGSVGPQRTNGVWVRLRRTLGTTLISFMHIHWLTGRGSWIMKCNWTKLNNDGDRCQLTRKVKFQWAIYGPISIQFWQPQNVKANEMNNLHAEAEIYIYTGASFACKLIVRNHNALVATRIFAIILPRIAGAWVAGTGVGLWFGRTAAHFAAAEQSDIAILAGL